MKVLFVITRLSDYRLLGPVIDCALRSKWQVECLHDYSFPTTGMKKYLFPAIAQAPNFQHGQPSVQSYRGSAELVERLKHGDSDAVVSMAPLQTDTAGAVPNRYPVWTCVQSGLDTLMNSSHRLKGCDLLALYTRWWLDWAVSHYEATERVSDVSALRRSLESRSRFVGSPEYEAVRLVDRQAVRRRWGIPSDQPVVVLLPFPQGVGRRTFWPKKIFSEPSRVRRVVNAITHGKLSYLGAAWSDVNDVDVVSAIRNFCDRNGAFLLVKSRQKTPIPPYLRAVSDKCIYDESFYPPTIIEALSIANLCISYYSLGVFEAAALRVPHFCIAHSAEDYLGNDAGNLDSLHQGEFFNRRPGGAFQFSGVSTTASADEAVALLQSRILDDFGVKVSSQDEYLKKFLGEGDGQAAMRAVDAIESFVQSTDVKKRRLEWLRELKQTTGHPSDNGRIIVDPETANHGTFDS